MWLIEDVKEPGEASDPGGSKAPCVQFHPAGAPYSLTNTQWLLKPCGDGALEKERTILKGAFFRGTLSWTQYSVGRERPPLYSFSTTTTYISNRPVRRNSLGLDA